MTLLSITVNPGAATRRWLCAFLGDHWMGWKSSNEAILEDLHLVVGRCRICRFTKVELQQQQALPRRGSPTSPGKFLRDLGS